MSNRTEVREQFIKNLIGLGKTTVTKSEIKEVCKSVGISSAQWFTREPSNKVGRGLYKVPTSGQVNTIAPATINLQAQVIPMVKHVEKSDNRIVNVTTDLEMSDMIPKSYKNYVPFGNFDDVISIVQSMRLSTSEIRLCIRECSATTAVKTAIVPDTAASIMFPQDTY